MDNGVLSHFCFLFVSPSLSCVPPREKEKKRKKKGAKSGPYFSLGRDSRSMQEFFCFASVLPCKFYLVGESPHPLD